MEAGAIGTDVPALLAGAVLGGLLGGAAGWWLVARARHSHAKALSRLSHDLKTPLSSITAYAEILLDDEDPGQRRRFLEIIREEAARMLGMLDAGLPGSGAPDRVARPTGSRMAAAGEERTILVVDDDRFLREAVRTALENRGFHAMASGGGEEAISRARENRPDVILMDLMMPGMGGDEVLRRLRADPITSGIPVIITTGEAGARVLDGAAAVLTKPISPESLIAAVNELIPGGASR